MSTFYTYGKLSQHLLQGEIDILNDTIKCMLLTSTASIDQDTNDVISDISSSEVTETGTNYVTGGNTVSDITISYSASINRTTIDCTDITWTTATIDAVASAIYVVGAQATNSYCIGYNDFGATKSCENSTFTVQIDSDGLFTMTND